ncbi:monooxygenase [Fusarium tjaetaba]|uniref:Monooxygenase n=1 Tax=Fusarium tjaetaba TaxID=1567544 RepID=A0A8H5W7T4_9HYPO|nr:monooxygenase [Fusarium tjaetaba]KAF5648423.1 monooxygenase [Fusarium tjaetaba]
MSQTDVLIIGAGMSGIGLGVQLIRKFGTRSFEIIEKDSAMAGTWRVNSYPGCGCDVPSHFYSYSFALNPNWSQAYAMQPEIQSYFNDVAKKYDIGRHVRFSSVVESARWDESTGIWETTIRDVETSEVMTRRSKVLISAVGALSISKECDIPGSSDFEGRIFHTSKWDHSFDWKDKEVVIVGNGCSATQVLPVISSGDGAVMKATQFARQAHWLAERPNPTYSATFKWIMRWIPFAMRLYRAWLYYLKERDFAGFRVAEGLRMRNQWARDTTDYIRRTAPAKYLDFLVPKTEVGCKRRVNDTDYLACLHRDNVELVYDDPIQKIEAKGVRTFSGRLVTADAIVLAHGFETQKPLFPMKIFGKNGVGINEHWNQVSEGAASSYFGTCLSEFPNFFIMMGPNTLSGHLSVIYTTECQINYTMRVLRPILKGKADIVEVTPEAEKKDIDRVQEKAKRLVWATGCTSWFIDEKTNRNTIMFPDWQFKFWLRSIFVAWNDLQYRNVSTNKPVETSRVNLTLLTVAVLVRSGRPKVEEKMFHRDASPAEKYLRE